MNDDSATIRRVAVELAPQLHQSDLESVLELLDHGEWGIAFEALCEQIHERGSRCKPEQVNDLLRVAMKLGVEISRFPILRRE